jgi:hypothetical protein
MKSPHFGGCACADAAPQAVIVAAAIAAAAISPRGNHTLARLRFIGKMILPVAKNFACENLGCENLSSENLGFW